MLPSKDIFYTRMENDFLWKTFIILFPPYFLRKKQTFKFTLNYFYFCIEAEKEISYECTDKLGRNQKIIEENPG